MSEQIKSGIYIITNTITGDCYIGSSVDINARLTSHKYMLQLGMHHSKVFQIAWDEYGANTFVFDVLEIVPNPDNLTIIEQRYLDERQPKYNLAKTALRNTSGIVTDTQMLRDRKEAKLVSKLLIMQYIDDQINLNNIGKIIYVFRMIDTQSLKILEGYPDLALWLHKRGVKTLEDFREFWDAGLRGLYEGETAAKIRQRRGLKPGADIYSHMGSVETVANDMKSVLAVHHIDTRGITDLPGIAHTHNEDGKAVREFLLSQGVNINELPMPTKSYEQLVREQAVREMLAEQDRMGLWGQLPSGEDDDPAE